MLRPPHHDDPRRGQALVEFALTLPILLMLVFGIIDLARVMFAYTQVVDASRQAVRYGIVEGLQAPHDQYFDCDAIRDAALDLPGVITLNPTVEITYHYMEEVPDAVDPTCAKDPLNPTQCLLRPHAPVTCESGPTVESFAYKYSGEMPTVELQVKVQGTVRPLTPIILPFASSIPISFTSTRTIVFQGAEYTDTWLVQPDRPRNFTATAECGLCALDENYEACYKGQQKNVSFSWSALSATPTKLEIYQVGISGPVYTMVDYSGTTCAGCAGIARSDSTASFYLIAYVGEEPLFLASPPSNSATVGCPKLPMPTGTGTISGFVWNDLDGNGSFNEPKQDGINGVQVELRHPGRNLILNDFDDYVVVATTAKINGNDGAFSFTALPAQTYLIQVPLTADGQVQTLLQGKTATTTAPITQPLADGQTVPDRNFGYR